MEIPTTGEDMIRRFQSTTAILVVLGFLLVAGSAAGQCILANPSFEIDGSGAAVFGGWNQFGAIGEVPTAYHGGQAARVSGPNNGTWDMSAFWQNQDCEPGEQWEVTGHVMNPGSLPLTGQNTALVNIEWRDAGGALIDYESTTVADASAPADVYLDFSFVSSPAPAGTAKIRVLLGTLQSPSDPVSDVYYDQVTFFTTSYPTVTDQQWNDFPGNRSIEFGGFTWRVKGPGWFGPGVNYFCHTPTCVWVDDQQQLHLTLLNQAGIWTSTEVVTEQALGYGDYVVTTVGRLDLLDPLAVFGIFLWEYGPCWDYSYTWWNAFNEIDIEYSRWMNPASDIAQFVAQPYDWSGNINRFDMTFSEGEVVSHAMRWLPDRVEYRVWRGGPGDESPANMVNAWTYTGPHIPRPEQPRLHLNLWRIDGDPASVQEIVIQDFNFVPAGGVSAVVDGPERILPPVPGGQLHPAAPNPFNPQTTLSFNLNRAGFTELKIHDVNGRLVRTLVSETLEAGEHQAIWNGRDDSGRAVASGVYLSVLSGSDFVESGRMVLLK
jgi:hypothetical protein